METLREVGRCQCVEHQAADRLREIIKELNLEIAKARAIIDSLRQDLYYWRDADEDIPDSAISLRGVPCASGDSPVADREGGEEKVEHPI